MNGPNSPPGDKCTQSGFTLIEIAVVLVIIGILVGLGAGLIGPATRRIKYTQSRDAVESAKAALLGYAVRVGRVPDDATADPLGVAGARKLDAWGRDLVYFSDPALEGGSVDACSVNATATVVQECTNADCSTFNTKSNIAFLVYSLGEDADGTGTGTASPFMVREQDSNYPNPATGPFHYDDIVAYGSLDEIRSQRQCSQPLVITSPATLSQGVEDQFYTTTLTATGGKPPYTWTSVTASGLTVAATGLVSGTININNAAPNTGELTTCGANISLTNVSVTDSAGTTAGPSTFTVPVIPQPLQILTQTLPAAYEGSVYSASISASGGSTPYTWSQSVVSACPTGMTCSGNSLTGTPSTGSAGTYTVTATANPAQTGACTVQKSFGLTVNSSTVPTTCSPLSLSAASGTTFSGLEGTAFSQTITVSGGTGPYTNAGCSNGCGGLGLNLNCSTGGTSVMSGTPTGGGTCSFSVAWTDSCSPTSQSITGNYTVSITPSCDAFTGWGSSLPATSNCSSFSGSVTVFGGESPLSWSRAAGSLPGGVSDCTGETGPTCVMSGASVLAAPGGYTFTMQATDSCANPSSQSSSNGFTIIVAADSCYAGGMGIRNSTGSTRYYRHSASAGTCRTLNNNAVTPAPQNIHVAGNETITFYTNATCTTTCGTAKTYCSEKLLDTGGTACRTRITGATCASSDN